MRRRLRELGYAVGRFPTGELNALVDVPGVLVGHRTLVEGERLRTGVTAILPHGGNLYADKVLGGCHVVNGYGKAAGLTQLGIWVGSLVALFAFLSTQTDTAQFLSTLPNITPLMIAYFLIFFIVGYFIYASMYALIGSMVTNRLSRRIGIGRTFVLGSILFPVPIILVPLADGPMWLILAMLFLAEFGSGLGVMILDISAASIFAALVPPRLRSRVSGAYTVVNYGVRPVGSVVGGLLGSQLGLRPALWIGTIGATLGVLWLLPSPIPKMRELPETEEPV